MPKSPVKRAPRSSLTAPSDPPPDSNPRKALALKLADQIAKHPNPALAGRSSVPTSTLIFQLYDQTAVLAAAGSQDTSHIYLPPSIAPFALSSSTPNPDEFSTLYRLALRQILSNVHQARLNLTDVNPKDVTDSTICPGDTSIPLDRIPKPAAPDTSKGKQPARGRPADPGLLAKLNQCLDALRRIRKALRLRVHVEDLAAQAQSAIAKYTAEGQTAPRALRDYRHRANVHISQIALALDDLIKRTADIETVEPVLPGRNSPPAKTPQSLGEPPVPATFASSLATEIPDFSRPFASDLTPASSRASGASNFKRDSPDTSDDQTTRVLRQRK